MEAYVGVRRLHKGSTSANFVLKTQIRQPSGGIMTNLTANSRKTWTKPNIDTALVSAAQAGSFNSTDAKHTHHS